MEFLRRIKLRNKIFLLCTSLVLLTTLVIQISSWWSSNQFNLRQLEQDVSKAKAVLSQYLEAQSSLLVTASKVLTADFAFKRAVATSDAETIQSALANHGSRINADIMVLTGMSGRIISSTTDDMSSANHLSSHEIQRLIDNPNKPLIVSLNDKIYQLILTPVKAPHVLAYNIVGFEINQEVVTQLKSLTGFDISFSQGDKHLLSTTFRLPSFNAFRQKLNDQESNWLLFERPAYLTEQLELPSASETAVKVMLISSLAPLYQQYDQSLKNNFVLAILMALLVSLGSIVFARSLTNPLSKLGQLAKAYAQGDYLRKMDIQGGEELETLEDNFMEMGRQIKSREDQIRYQATHDILTGLPNQYTIREKLSESMVSNERLILIAISIHNFRQINDHLGADIADRCLQALAKRLNALNLDMMFSGRLEGAEFFSVIRYQVGQIPFHLVEAYLGALENAFIVSGLTIKLDLSAGVTLYPENGNQSDTMLRRTAIALDGAHKQSLRIHCYEDGEDEQHLQRLAMMEDLRHVLLSDGADQLFMVYQPKIYLDGDEQVKTEALIRWRRENNDLVSPEIFINLAEEASLIVDLTHWVFERVIWQIKQWHQAGQPISAAINVSAQDLSQPDFETFVVQCCERYEVSPNGVTIEITERDIMHDEATVVMALRGLKRKGFTIAIDDYGIGQSSLSKLKGLPVDEIKLDKSFIMQLDQSPKDQLIVRSTIELAHGLGFEVVAEGVENQETLSLLKQFGCDQIQGYFIAKPMTAEAAAEWRKNYVQDLNKSRTSTRYLLAGAERSS